MRQQRLGLLGRPPDRDRDRRVGDPALVGDADVDREDVAAAAARRGPGCRGPPSSSGEVQIEPGKAAVALEGGDGALGGMNFSAASSSSAVVTPGRHLERSIFRQRAWIAPAAAIASSCSDGLSDDSAVVHRDHHPLDLLLLRGEGRDQGRGCRSPRRRAAARRRPAGGSPASRRSRSAARSSRGTARAGGGSPRACRRRGRSACCRRCRRRPPASGGSNSTWKTWPFSSQVRRPLSRRMTSSSSTSIRIAAVILRPEVLHLLEERLGLGDRARKAVEDEAVGRLLALHPLADDAR